MPLTAQAGTWLSLHHYHHFTWVMYFASTMFIEFNYNLNTFYTVIWYWYKVLQWRQKTWKYSSGMKSKYDWTMATSLHLSEMGRPSTLWRLKKEDTHRYMKLWKSLQLRYVKRITYHSPSNTTQGKRTAKSLEEIQSNTGLM